MNEQMKIGAYKITIKSRFGRWIVGQNRTLGWCVIDRETTTIIETGFDRNRIERVAQNRLIKDQDAARAKSSAASSFRVEVMDPRTGDWNAVTSDVSQSRAAEIAAQFIGGDFAARIA